MQSSTGESECSVCGQRFENPAERDQHVAMAHEGKWTGRSNQSENGDENATGAVSPKTADTIATKGGTDRPNARERAAARQDKR